MEERLGEDGVKVTLTDYIRLLQLKKDLDEEAPREVRVQWVEPGEAILTAEPGEAETGETVGIETTPLQRSARKKSARKKSAAKKVAKKVPAKKRAPKKRVTLEADEGSE